MKPKAWTPATDSSGDLDAPTAALAASALEMLRHVQDTHGAPYARWFALARTSDLLSNNPGIAALLGVGEATDGEDAPDVSSDPLHLTPIEMDDLPRHHDPLAQLADIRWPGFCDGGAVVIDIDADKWRSASQILTSDVDGSNVRVVVAVDSSGATWSILSPQDSTHMRMGAVLLPDISDALVEAFSATH